MLCQIILISCFWHQTHRWSWSWGAGQGQASIRATRSASTTCWQRRRAWGRAWSIASSTMATINNIIFIGEELNDTLNAWVKTFDCTRLLCKHTLAHSLPLYQSRQLLVCLWSAGREGWLLESRGEGGRPSPASATSQRVAVLERQWVVTRRIAWVQPRAVRSLWGDQGGDLTVNCPTRWSLLFIFAFLCWSSILHYPDNREI